MLIINHYLADSASVMSFSFLIEVSTKLSTCTPAFLKRNYRLSVHIHYTLIINHYLAGSTSVASFSFIIGVSTTLSTCTPEFLNRNDRLKIRKTTSQQLNLIQRDLNSKTHSILNAVTLHSFPGSNSDRQLVSAKACTAFSAESAAENSTKANPLILVDSLYFGRDTYSMVPNSLKIDWIHSIVADTGSSS